MSVFCLKDGFRAFLGVVMLCTLCRENWCAPSANDNFADREQLEGESFEIRGSVSGGTLEQGELSKTINSVQPYYIGGSTVWYSWKSPADSLVLVKPKTRTSGGLITISTGSTMSEAQQSENVLAELVFPTPFLHSRYATFHAEKDTEYQIRVCGFDYTNMFEIAWVLTNLPVILDHPRTRTVSPGAPALFTIAPAAYEDRVTTIQWQFNGTNLPDQTGRTLGLTNVTADLAGDYASVATSLDEKGGFISRTSRVAQLIVKEPARPSLRVEREKSGVFMYVEGDVGRSYELITLRGFDPEGGKRLAFSSELFPMRFMGGLFGPSSLGEIVVAEVYAPLNPICNLQMKRITFAKNWFATDRGVTMGEECSISDLEPYLSEEPRCPEGGEYFYNNIGTDPVCRIWTHVVEAETEWW